MIIEDLKELILKKILKIEIVNLKEYFMEEETIMIVLII